jgi:hypothetical protein
MKLPPLLLAVSLVANATLVGALARYPSVAPPAVRDFMARQFHFAADPVPAAPAVNRAAPAPRKTLWPALDSGGDLATLVARLRAAGFPPAVIRGIVLSELSTRYNAQIRALDINDPNTPFWKLRGFSSADDKRLIEINQLQRERAKLVRELLGDSFFTTDDVSPAQRRQFGNLPRTKIDLLQRVEDDYAEMTAAVRATMGGITLPEDSAKLALLARERHFLRSRLGGFDPTETEFRALFQAQESVNAMFPAGPGASVDPERAQIARQEFISDLRVALGDARYADYVRETSNDFQQLSRLAQRAALPSDTAVQAFNLRDAVAQDSNRIFDDASLNGSQKRTALQTLAQNTRAQLTAMLGPVVGPAYVKVADQWLTTVERGAAVSFNASVGLSIVGTQGSATINNSPSFRRLPPPRPGP